MKLSLWETDEIKNYRTSYFILITFSVLGMILCLFLYRYTSFFTGFYTKGRSYSLLSANELMVKFGKEALQLLLVFLGGFTVFSLPICILFCIWRGFICGFCAMSIANAYSAGDFTSLQSAVMAICTTLIPALEVCIAAKAQCFGTSLRFAAPDLKAILRARETQRYSASFLTVTLFVFILTALLTFIS